MSLSVAEASLSVQGVASASVREGGSHLARHLGRSSSDRAAVILPSMAPKKSPIIQAIAHSDAVSQERGYEGFQSAAGTARQARKGGFTNNACSAARNGLSPARPGAPSPLGALALRGGRTRAGGHPRPASVSCGP